MIYNDYPIANSEADKLGRAGFAKSVAKAIADYIDDNSISIGLCGEWGSGKTSTLNLIEKEINSFNLQQKAKHKNVVIKFNPWNFTNQDQLLEQFFKFLKKELKIVDFSEVAYKNGVVYEKISKAAKVFSFLPFVGKLSKLIGDYGEALKSFKNDKSLDEIKSKINKRLEQQKRKFIVFIDDIDRLSDNEIAQMFQLVKLIADFKNIIYVLSFDKKVVVSALKKVQPDFADQYLEKIIQIPFELPAADKKKIQEMLFERLNATIKDLPDLSKHRISRLYMTGV